MDDVRICAVLIKAFHSVIQNRPDAQAILSRALERKKMPNHLAQLVTANRINRYRVQFTRIELDKMMDNFQRYMCFLI